MKISSTRSGGFAAPATDKHWGPVDTAEAGDKGREMESLVGSLGFFDLKNLPIVGDDELNYTIEVVDGGRDHTVSYSDPGKDVSPDLKKLQTLIEDVAPSG